MTLPLQFQQGNTIRLSVQFKDWNGAAVDPTIVKFIVYDGEFEKTDESTIGIGNRIDAGSYFYDLVPNQSGTIYIEWYGEIDGLPSLKRERIEIRKV